MSLFSRIRRRTAPTSGRRRPISPRLHGEIDYGLGLGTFTFPSLLGLEPRARLLFGAFGLVQGTLNAVTDQPYALTRVVPFRTHGLIEKASLPAFVALPLLTGVLKDRKALAYFLGMGAALVTVYNLTDWDAINTSR